MKLPKNKKYFKINGVRIGDQDLSELFAYLEFLLTGINEYFDKLSDTNYTEIKHINNKLVGGGYWYSKNFNPPKTIEKLTPQETEVMRMIIDGLEKKSLRIKISKLLYAIQTETAEMVKKFGHTNHWTRLNVL